MTRGCSFSIKTIFPGIGISILKMRRSWDHLIFIMGISVHIRQHLKWKQCLTCKQYMIIHTKYFAKYDIVTRIIDNIHYPNLRLYITSCSPISSVILSNKPCNGGSHISCILARCVYSTCIINWHWRPLMPSMMAGCTHLRWQGGYSFNIRPSFQV